MLPVVMCRGRMTSSLQVEMVCYVKMEEDTEYFLQVIKKKKNAIIDC